MKALRGTHVAEMEDTATTINLYTVNTNNNFTNDIILNENEPFWRLLMDRSQLVMTVVGLIANLGTSITLIKNGQVCTNAFYTMLYF